MAKRKFHSPGTPSPLPHSAKVPLSPDTLRLLNRHTKSSLLILVQSWLTPSRYQLFSPNLFSPEDDDVDDDDDEEESPAPAISLEGATEIYADMERSKSARAKDVISRMTEYEFRDGLTLLGIAELEYHYLLSHLASSKWRAMLLSPVTKHTHQPRFHAPTFLSSLSASLRPSHSAHFFCTPHPSLPLTVLRISLHPSFTPLLFPTARSAFWLAFPQGSDHIFTTLTARSGDADILHSAIAAGLSRSNARFEVKAGRFVAKTLEACIHYRGAEGASGGLAGGWSVYVDGFEPSPLQEPREIEVREESPKSKRGKIVEARFGSDKPGVESVSFTVVEKFEDWTPEVTVQFEGGDVFRGLRELAEKGEGVVVEKVPGWMTGEEGVTSGTVKDGRVQRKKGQGRWSHA